MTVDEMVGWHHQLNGHESEQTLGDCEGQGSLACCSPWGRKESNMTEQLNNSYRKPACNEAGGCCCSVTELCPTLCDPMDYTVHVILQARILEWVAVPFSRGSSQLRH